VRIIVPFPPGGSNDAVARPLAEKMLARRFGQPFVADNKPGAGSTIGSAEVARAPADSHMLLVTSSTFATSAAVQPTPYDAARDFECVALLATAPLLVLGAPDFPPNSLAEVETYIRANPDKVDYGSAGPGSINQMAAELFAQRARGLRMQHVPYRGAGPAYPDLITGKTQVFFDNLPGSVEFVKTGQLRALGVTSAKRSFVFPDVPSIGETVPGYDVSLYYGVSAPKGTPPDIVATLNNAINKALADPKMKERIAGFGGEPLSLTPEQFGKMLADETVKWEKVVKTVGLAIE